jgi:hypothetical protein
MVMIVVYSSAHEMIALSRRHGYRGGRTNPSTRMVEASVVSSAHTKSLARYLFWNDFPRFFSEKTDPS